MRLYQNHDLTFLGELMSLSAPWMTPIFGIGAIVSMLFLQADSSWGSLWKMLFSLVFGVFLSMAALVWKDNQRRHSVNESAIAETNRIINDRMRENERIVTAKLDAMAKKQERMFGMQMLQAVYSSDGDKDKLVEAIKSMIEHE